MYEVRIPCEEIRKVVCEHIKYCDNKEEAEELEKYIKENGLAGIDFDEVEDIDVLDVYEQDFNTQETWVNKTKKQKDTVRHILYLDFTNNAITSKKIDEKELQSEEFEGNIYAYADYYAPSNTAEWFVMDKDTKIDIDKEIKEAFND